MVRPEKISASSLPTGPEEGNVSPMNPTDITRRAFANGARTAREVVTTAQRFGLGRIRKFEAEEAIQSLINDGTFEVNRFGGVVPVLDLEGNPYPRTLLGR